MPNNFKSFLKPSASKYVFPDAEELQMDEEREESPLLLEEEASPAALPEEETETLPPEEKRKSPVDFAQIQAAEILTDARRQAEEILEESREAARVQAEAQAAEARNEGYRQGYDEGLAQGRLEGQVQLEQQMVQQGQEIQRYLEKATQAREELLSQAKDELRDLSIAIAEKVIHISLKSSSEVIAKMIQVATEKLKRREWVHIYVAGCDAKHLAQITPELMTALAGVSDHVKIIPMADDETGTCIIEMPDEIIDASASTQLSNIREMLSES